MEMGHIVRIQSREQYIAALNVLDYVEGTFHARGPSSAPVLFVADNQFSALVKAGVISANGKEVMPRGKKTTAKKVKP
jgi:hypothetical protein